MVELIVYSLPTLIYLLVQSRRCRRADALRDTGLSWGGPRSWLWALALLPPLLLIMWAALAAIPADALNNPGVVIASTASLGAVARTVAQVAGEEILFRGLVGGITIRRLGFWWGNLAQTAVFILPHLVLLLVDASLWPLLPAQFLAGWLLGWLRHRSGSVLPGIVLHAAVNLTAGALA